MFGSLWNVVVAHEHRRQDGVDGQVQTATDERAWQPWSRPAGSHSREAGNCNKPTSRNPRFYTVKARKQMI